MRIIGKIERGEKCPIGKTNPCDECHHYDGWGVDIIKHELHVWCFPKKVIESTKMKMVVPTI